MRIAQRRLSRAFRCLAVIIHQRLSSAEAPGVILDSHAAGPEVLTAPQDVRARETAPRYQQVTSSARFPLSPPDMLRLPAWRSLLGVSWMGGYGVCQKCGRKNKVS